MPLIPRVSAGSQDKPFFWLINPEIYVEDGRRDELLSWWNSLKSSTFSDPSLFALCKAQIALILGSPEAAHRALDSVPNDSHQDGEKALKVAHYRVNQLHGVDEKAADGDGQARMDSSLTMAQGYYHDSVSSSLSVLGINARGVNFNIDKDKLNRPGVALPIGFFY